jgi:uncharacterized protein with HEPN domain
MKTNDVYLQHIREAIQKIESYTAGVDRAEFEADGMRQDAVVRQMEIIGEARRQLSESFREENASIPWPDIIGMQNRIAHDYMNVDLDIVSEVVHQDLPRLKSFLDDFSAR